MPVLLVVGLVVPTFEAAAQERIVAERAALENEATALSLTVQDAIEIALARAYSLRQRDFDRQDAKWQVKGGWGQMLPQISANSDFSRNIITPNPFAGSDAGSIFSTLTFVDWLAYNEGTRTDGDPTTNPLDLDEFRSRQMQGLDDAGIVLNPSANPFQVDNQWRNTLTLDQTLYDGSLFSGIRASKVFRDMSEAGFVREAQMVVNQVKVAFFGSIFAAEQASVVRKSVARTAKTVEEAKKRLAQGVASKYDMLSAEVEMVNLESDLIRVENALEDGLDQLKMILGLPIEQPIILRGNLENVERSGLVNVTLGDALTLALAQRADLEQAALSVEINRISEKIERASRHPTLKAFVDVGYIGSIPKDRQVVSNVDDDPFQFESQDLGFFDSSYWDGSAVVGFRLNWKIFDGRQTHANIQRARINQQRAEVRYEQMLNQVKREIGASRREVFAAERRMTSQARNVLRAELNYEYASTRLREGVSSRLEERQASELLDDSRLNYNRAIFDYLVAQADFETAVGTSVVSQMPDGSVLPTDLSP